MAASKPTCSLSSSEGSFSHSHRVWGPYHTGWAVSLSRQNLSTLPLKALGPHSSRSALPPASIVKDHRVRSTSIDFAKNQLSLSLIGLSPLISSHPRLLLQTSVRSFKSRYAFCNLLEMRSLSFGSNDADRSRRAHLLLLCVHLLAYAGIRHLVADPLCKRYTGSAFP
eukprot:20029-Pelagococcus_subviridis.AAC.2